LQAVKRAAQDWLDNGKTTTWLTHKGGRLEGAERVFSRPDLTAYLTQTDRDYLAACRKAESDAKNRKRMVQVVIYVLLVGMIAGLLGWINQEVIKREFNWYAKTLPHMYTNVRPYVLKSEAEHALKPGDSFSECRERCPTMIVIPAGEFTMGSPPDEPARSDNEGPQHRVKIAKAFAVSKYELRFDEWDVCVAVGGCRAVSDNGWGHDAQPAINVSWFDSQQYVNWLSLVTGRPYRLLTEAEWEYAARAGTTTAFYWGEGLGRGNANCNGCGSKWSGKQPAPVGSFPPNAFGLHDMTGNVWQWVQDCYAASYNGVPTDGSGWIDADCRSRVVRGGSWVGLASSARPRSAYRDWRPPDSPSYGIGIRVGRTLEQ
jgi:formylglycine-generating enzyme required for sulfatase activity